ncbi:MAG: hypothetical protein RIR37_374 [Verrucomicrobiota bacterium]
MKKFAQNNHPAGYASVLMVLSMGTLLLILAIFSYRKAVSAHSVQSSVQLRVDYLEKEDAILRSIVAITPNRAIRAMRHMSETENADSASLTWKGIFTDALALANAGQSISNDVLATISAGQSPIAANSGDSQLSDIAAIFKSPEDPEAHVAAGINRNLGSLYPVPLTCNDSSDTARDSVWPIISHSKKYGSLAQTGVILPVANYQDFNLIEYPNINFGYSRPGQPFVAKRNWWAFDINLSEQDSATTQILSPKRRMVLSIYEIPSQLAISSSAFMSLGRNASGTNWGDINIIGGVFAGRALVEGDTNLASIATRRGASIAAESSIGNTNFDGDPFAPGIRESHYLTSGDFFPVSLASESGRAAFVPINRGADFFDRFSHTPETHTLSSTTWNQYSVGALQCAMQLDVIDTLSPSDKTPSSLRFSYFKNGERQQLVVPQMVNTEPGLPQGYISCASAEQSHDFGSAVVDVAYGGNGVFAFKTAVTGIVTFNEATFGPLPDEISKLGYFKPSFPFEATTLPDGKNCIAVYPQRFENFLTALNADDTSINHSLVVNVDYTVATGSANLSKPSIPCTNLDYGVILKECADMRSFAKGFSLVTNLRLYLGDDFNITPATPPMDYDPPDAYYPPCSIFAPEKRYGVDVEPLGVNLSGQIGSLASESAASPVRPLESKTINGASIDSKNIKANLRPITHPAELPPVSMMNWLILLEEIR